MRIKLKSKELGHSAQWKSQGGEEDSYEGFRMLTAVLSLGLVEFMVYIYPEFEVLWYYVNCRAEDADAAVLEIDGEKVVAYKVEHHSITDGGEHIIAFEVQYKRIYACSSDGFQLHYLPDVPSKFSQYLAPGSERNRDLIATLYGENVLDVPSLHLPQEYYTASTSFVLVVCYIGIVIWIMMGYYVYSALFLLICVQAVDMIVKNRWEERDNIKTVADVTAAAVKLLSGPGKAMGGEASVSSLSLVVGDRIRLRDNCELDCDLLLAKGTVVMDESKITGESMPRTKVPSDAAIQQSSEGAGAAAATLEGVIGKASAATSDGDESDDLDGSSVLYAGTIVKSASPDAEAVVFRSGFRTAKGSLVASLLEPDDKLAVFYGEMKTIVAVMMTVSFVLYIASSANLIKAGAGFMYWAFYSIDVVTIAIPLALIITAIIATTIATYYLRQKGISVFHAALINLGGQVNIVGFDKTGTLTEDALALDRVVAPDYVVRTDSQMLTPRQAEKGAPDGAPEPSPQGTLHEIQVADAVSGLAAIPPLVKEIMATCQSVGVLDGPGGRKYAGDPLELELLRASGWILHPQSPQTNNLMSVDPPELHGERAGEGLGATGSISSVPQGYKIISRDRRLILRSFTFSATKLRACSLVRRPNGADYYYVKGAAEVVVPMCDPVSVPRDLQGRVDALTRKGLRVIAIAYRRCPENIEQLRTLSQDEIESRAPLTFAGLLSLTNRLHHEATSTVKALREANIAVKMITGDHINTAVTTARACGILSETVQSMHGPGAAAAPPAKPADVANTVYLIDGAKDGQVVITNADTGTAVDTPLYTVIEEAISTSGDQVLAAQKESDVRREKRRREARASGVGIMGLDQQQDLRHLLGSSFTISTTYGHGSYGTSASTPTPSSPPTEADPEAAERKMAPVVELAVTAAGLACVQRTEDELTLAVLCRVAKVFARTKPLDKKFVVEQCSAVPAGLKFRTGAGGADSQHDDMLFCGDGANDMLALRSATIGLSLCNVKTSVAAPFTSSTISPAAVLEVLLRGRDSLALTYALTNATILTNSALVLQICLGLWYVSEPSDSMYVVNSIFFIQVLFLGMVLAPPHRRLEVDMLPARYLTSSLFGHMVPQLLLMAAVQFTGLVMLAQMDFYTMHTADTVGTSLDHYCYEGTVLQNLLLAQCVIACIVSHIGEPVTEEWYANKPFVLLVSLCSAWVLYQLFAGDTYFATSILDLVPTPAYFGFMMVGLISVNAAAAIALKQWTSALLGQSVVSRRTVPLLKESRRGGETLEI